MRDSTLLFLIKKDGARITDICLAMKKRGFGKGRYNGVGGKVEVGETIQEATLREAKEEIGITVSAIKKYAELTFTFPHNPLFDQNVHVYMGEGWEGEPKESEEMNPKWFKVEEIPYQSMWPDDIHWLPLVLDGKNVRAQFSLGEHDDILEKTVSVVEEL